MISYNFHTIGFSVLYIILKGNFSKSTGVVMLNWRRSLTQRHAVVSSVLPPQPHFPSALLQPCKEIEIGEKCARVRHLRGMVYMHA